MRTLQRKFDLWQDDLQMAYLMRSRVDWWKVVGVVCVCLSALVSGWILVQVGVLIMRVLA